MLFYNALIYLYHFIVFCFSFFNTKARLFVQGRKHVMDDLRTFKKNNTGKNIWIHCSSLGEFEQARPLIEELKKKYPSYKLILTFFSPSGYEIRKNYELADFISYLPADTKAKATTFIHLLQPSLVVFIKYEFWLNYLKQLKKRNIPTLLVSGIFRKEQHFFKWYGGIFRTSLSTYKHLFLQNTESLELMHQLGIINCSVSGDTRFDQVDKILKAPQQFSFIQDFCRNKKIIVAGSTWYADEQWLIPAFSTALKNDNDLKLIIAPHNLTELALKRLNDLILQHQLSAVSYTNRQANGTADHSILILDTMGMLSSVYQYGQLAYIGGGFGDGIHNILEALTFGLPVLFGPNYKKYHEAVESISLGAGYTFNSLEELNELIYSFMERHQQLSNAQQNAKEYVQRNLGSTAKIMKYIEAEVLH